MFPVPNFFMYILEYPIVCDPLSYVTVRCISAYIHPRRGALHCAVLSPTSLHLFLIGRPRYAAQILSLMFSLFTFSVLNCPLCCASLMSSRDSTYPMCIHHNQKHIIQDHSPMMHYRCVKYIHC